MQKSAAGAPIFVKQVISVLKSKSMAIKNKAEALKARLVMCSLLRNYKRLPLAAVISRKVHAILGVGSPHEQQPHDHTPSCGDEQEMLEEAGGVDYYYNNHYCYYNSNHEYNNLESEEIDQLQQGAADDAMNNASSSSVIDMVKNSKQEGEDFRLEDEIDHVADLFITKFHKRMKLQKLESFKRYQDMLARGAA